jgi:hypothetical protein
MSRELHDRAALWQNSKGKAIGMINWPCSMLRAYVDSRYALTFCAFALLLHSIHAMLSDNLIIACLAHSLGVEKCKKTNSPLTFAIHLVLGECNILQLDIDASCRRRLPQVFI